MKKIRFLIPLISLIMVISLSISCTATSIGDEDNTFAFTNSSIQRVDDDGSFYVRIRSSIESNKFYALNYTLTLKMTGKIYDQATGKYSTDSSISYTATLYRDGLFDTKVGTLHGVADGKEMKCTFSVESGDKYYLYITYSPSFASSGNGKYFYADGSIKHISTVKGG